MISETKVIAFVYILLGIFSSYTRQATGQANITFTLSARKLPNFDIFNGPPDPYIILSLFTNKTSPGINVGKTDKLSNTRDPTWPNLFNFNYTGGFCQRIRFDLWDEDVDADDYMGHAEATLHDIASAFGNVLQIPFVGDAIPGYLIIDAKLTSNSALLKNLNSTLYSCQ